MQENIELDTEDLKVDQILDFARSISDQVFNKVNDTEPQTLEKLMPFYSSVRARRSKWRAIGTVTTVLFIVEHLMSNKRVDLAERIWVILLPYLNKQEVGEKVDIIEFSNLFTDLVKKVRCCSQEMGQDPLITTALWVRYELSNRSLSDEDLRNNAVFGMKLCQEISQQVEESLSNWFEKD